MEVQAVESWNCRRWNCRRWNCRRGAVATDPRSIGAADRPRRASRWTGRRMQWRDCAETSLLLWQSACVAYGHTCRVQWGESIHSAPDSVIDVKHNAHHATDCRLVGRGPWVTA